MVVSSFLLCEPSLFLCICRLLLIFHTIKFVVKICHTNDVYFYRAMLRKAQYCGWTSFVCPSVCNVAV